MIVGGSPPGEEVVLVAGEMLGKGDGDEFFIRIDLAVSRGRAVPAELAQARRHGTTTGIQTDFDAEAKALRAIEA